MISAAYTAPRSGGTQMPVPGIRACTSDRAVIALSEPAVTHRDLNRSELRLGMYAAIDKVQTAMDVKICNVALYLIAALAAAACGAPGRSESDSWLRTYPARLQNLCPASRAVDPVVGSFDGDALASGDRAWLVAADGSRLYVVWPQGFTLSFQPGPILRDERGRVVAEKDTSVTLLQVNRSDHSGTMDDPYIALGALFNGCYAEAL